MTSEERIAADRDLLRALVEIDEGLSLWEVEFVDHLAREARDHGSGWGGLSGKQRRKAEEIARENDV